MSSQIKIIGAREHNLKDISLSIPKNKLVVFTGVSGSGKSSLAMDTLFVEGQRRYVESLSSYARQFLGMAKKPDVDTIVGLTPAIAINQSAISHNPRSTVGTVTEVYDYLRLLFAKIGHPHCPQCGREITTQTSQKIVEAVFHLIKENYTKGRGIRLMVLSPIVQDKKGEFSKLFENLKRQGYQRVRIDKKVFGLDEEFSLIRTNRHTIEVVVDRLVFEGKNKDFRARLSDSIETALKLSDGLVIICEIKDASFSFPKKPTKMVDHLFSEKYACPICNLSLSEFEPRNFSFNSPHGACEECDGLGVKLRIDPSLVSPWRAERLEWRYRTTISDAVRKKIEELMIIEPCLRCKGTRLKKESLSVTIEAKNIAQVSHFSLKRLFTWVKKLSPSLSEKEKEIARPILAELFKRLSFLNSVGLDYLSLDRSTRTLAVGEAQRIRLASQIGTGLSGVLYILDEPTIGLHPRDTQRLIKTLKKLRDLGNTVLVIEHDRKMIESADWIFDFGPGAGKKGGRIVAYGKLNDIWNNKKSLTGLYLKGKRKVDIKNNQSRTEGKSLRIIGCQEYNLKDIDVSLPLGQFICVTGVSGAGKSTLIQETLYRALKRHFSSSSKKKPGQYRKIEGLENIGRVLLVDQSPIGKTSRSNPATYVSVFTNIRELFSQTREARIRGYSKSYFSFNLPGGRCEECRGQGEIKVEMQFLPDVYVTCESCRGKRFTEETLEVEYKEKNITDILNLTIDEAIEFFEKIPGVLGKLEPLRKIGLGYLQLGQPSPTLSGGEAQRLKLARELVKKSPGNALYLLDEPTVGLHFEDLKKLLVVIRELVNRGNTVIVIEHNPEVIKNADWIIDLGPEGGDEGGKIVAQGRPEEVAQNRESYTGQFL